MEETTKEATRFLDKVPCPVDDKGKHHFYTHKIGGSECLFYCDRCSTSVRAQSGKLLESGYVPPQKQEGKSA